MVGEEFAWGMIKKGLNLTDEDVEAIREGVLALKDMAPEAVRRAEMTEKRVLAICLYLKDADPDRWKRAEVQAQELFRKG